MDTDKEKEEAGQDKLPDELQDEIVATLRYLRKAQKRLEIGLIIGFVLLYVWAQLPAMEFLIELFWFCLTWIY